MERHLKGMANHHRIDILLLLAKQRGISLNSIATALDANEKTIGEHARRLYVAGLVNKKYQGNVVEHFALRPNFCPLFKNFSNKWQQ